MIDRIKVLCTRCRMPFRVKTSNLRDGFQTSCPSCNRMITFDSDSQDQGVRRAMTEARRIRNGYVPPAPAETER